MEINKLITNLENIINDLKKLPKHKKVMSNLDEGGYTESYRWVDVNFINEVDEEDDIVYFTILFREDNC